MYAQDFEDGLYHEEEEEPGRVVIGLQDIVGIDWGTSQSLKLGDNDFTPALVLHVLQPGASQHIWSSIIVIMMITMIMMTILK